jgi:WD40 repeat protein
VGAGPFVFLSYSHWDEEWCTGFSVVLKPLVQERGSVLWVDREGIRAGEVWRDELEAAIRASTLALLLVSPHFLESRYIMREELTALEECGVLRLPVLVRECEWAAEPRLERLQWIHDRRVALGAEGRTVRASTGDIVRISRRLATRLEETQRAAVRPPAAEAGGVAAIAPSGRAGDLSNVPPPPPGYVAREELEALRGALLSAQSASVGLTGDAEALGLHGQGGIGKTVLAVALARDRSVGLHFPDGIFWVTLGEAGDPVAAQLDLLARLGEPHMGLRTASAGRERLREVLRVRRCLVIVDDVWSADAALALTATGPGGRTLYTTRDQAVLEAIGARVERVDALPVAAARELLAAVAGTAAERLPPDADRVIAATDRVALALALVGAAAAHGRSWAEIAEELALESDTFLDHPYANTFKALQVGVSALGPELARAYPTLAVFPGDTRIPHTAVARYWAHLWDASAGDARATLEALAERGLLTLQDDGFSFHDLQRDFALLQAGRQAIVSHGELLAAYQEMAGARWSHLPRDEDYLWQHLIHHLRAARRHSEIAATVTDLGYLAIRVAQSGPYAAETDLRQAATLHPKDESIAWLQRLVTQWSHVLIGDQRQIAATLAAHAEGAPTGVDATELAALLPTRYLAPRRSMPAPPRTLVRVFEHPREGPGIALAPDGSTLVAARSFEVIVWEVESGDVAATLETKAATKAAYSPDGSRLAVGGPLGVDVWAGRSYLGNLRVPGGSWIEALAFSGDARRLVAGGTGTTCMWEVDSGSVVGTLDLTLRGLDGVPVQYLAVSLDGRCVAVVDEHGGVRLWEPDGGRSPRQLRPPYPDKRRRKPLAVKFTPDGTQLRVARIRDLETWDARSGALVSALHRESAALAAAFTPDAAAVALDEDPLALRNALTGELLASLQTTGEVPDILAISDDRRFIASAGESAAIRVWDMSAHPGELEPERVWIRPLLAPGGRAVALHSGDDLEIWDVAAEQRLPFQRPPGLPRGADAFDGASLAFSRGAVVAVWSLETGQRVGKLRRFRKVRTPLGKDWGRVCFGPAGLLAIAEPHAVRIWDPAAGRIVGKLGVGVAEPMELAFSPDGAWIALLGYDSLAVGRTGAGEQAWLFEESDYQSMPVFSTDSRHIAGGLRDGGVFVRDVATGAVEVMLADAAEREALAFSPDGSLFATGRGDHLDVWALETASLVAMLRIGVEIEEVVWGSWGITAVTREGLLGVELR